MDFAFEHESGMVMLSSALFARNTKFPKCQLLSFAPQVEKPVSLEPAATTANAADREIR